MIPGLSVVIPVYRSASILPELVEELRQVLPTVADSYELILVDDASPDESWTVIQDLSGKHLWVHGFSLMRNYGQHNAVLAGIRAARYDVTVTMDDDLQHPPEEIATLISELSKGFDVVYGTPRKEQHGIMRNVASILTKMTLQGAMGADTARNISAFRAFRTALRDAFPQYRGSFVSIDVLLTWATTRFGHTKVSHNPRKSGRSNYTMTHLVAHAFNMMTGFSVLPLQVASVVGFALTLFGGGVLVYVVGRYLIQGGSVPGFPFLASIIAIFSGAQLFAIGIIGEYLARMHFRIMDKPSYVIGDQTK